MKAAGFLCALVLVCAACRSTTDVPVSLDDIQFRPHRTDGAPGAEVGPTPLFVQGKIALKPLLAVNDPLPPDPYRAILDVHVEDGAAQVNNTGDDILFVPQGLFLPEGDETYVVAESILVEPGSVSLIPLMSVNTGWYEAGNSVGLPPMIADWQLRSHIRLGYGERIWLDGITRPRPFADRAAFESRLSAATNEAMRKLPPYVRGVAVFVDGRQRASDVFRDPSISATLMEPLVRGYLAWMLCIGDSGQGVETFTEFSNRSILVEWEDTPLESVVQSLNASARCSVRLHASARQPWNYTGPGGRTEAELAECMKKLGDDLDFRWLIDGEVLVLASNDAKGAGQPLASSRWLTRTRIFDGELLPTPESNDPDVRPESVRSLTPAQRTELIDAVATKCAALIVDAEKKRGKGYLTLEQAKPAALLLSHALTLLQEAEVAGLSDDKLIRTALWAQLAVYGLKRAMGVSQPNDRTENSRAASEDAGTTRQTRCTDLHTGAVVSVTLVDER